MSNDSVVVKGVFILSRLTKICLPSSQIPKRPLLSFLELTTTLTPSIPFDPSILPLSQLQTTAKGQRKRRKECLDLEQKEEEK